MPIPDTLIDQVLDGRYKLVRKLGTGGMANVYLAEDQELGRRVAIKILNDRHAHDDQFVERFRREAKNAAGLSHPNIVSIYDRGEAGGTYYIAMEYLEGRTLKELIVTRGPSPIPVAVDYARQVLAALGFAHRNGIVHRDIKPHNVIVGSDGRVKVTDFGIARSGASQMTEAGSIIGTAQYLSPEQARGAPVSPASDIYSVGIVLYEMLTGSVPFTGETPLEIAMKHLSSTPEPPSARRPEVPPELDAVVLRALAKDPALRYPNADDMEADLARVVRGVAVDPATEDAATSVLSGADAAAASPTIVARAPTEVVRRPVPPPPAVPPPVPPLRYRYDEPPRRRRPVWPWLLALGLLVLAGFAGWYAYTKIEEELNANRPVTVPDVERIHQPLAIEILRKAGLKWRVIKGAHRSVAPGRVFRQRPEAGERIDRGNRVSIWVSIGKPKTTVPDVRGKHVAEAVDALEDARLVPKVFYLNSAAEENTVTGQAPGPDEVVLEQTTVRINVSKGPAPIPVPSVTGRSYDDAVEQLRAQGFAVAREDVDSEEPEETVVGQDPEAGVPVPPGSTVTLSVSRGPPKVTVPDVVGLTRKLGTRTLAAAGFRIAVVVVETEDPSADGIIGAQDPEGGSDAVEGSIVTLTVGRYSGPPPTTETIPTDTTVTDTAPTDTTVTDTIPTETIPTDTSPTTTEPPPPPPP